MKRSATAIFTAAAIALLPACATKPDFGLTLTVGYNGAAVSLGYHPPARPAPEAPAEWESGKAPVPVEP